MKKTKMALFDTKPYDIISFEERNKDSQFEIKYFTEHLSLDTVVLTKGYDIVCIFVNDIITKDIIDKMYEYGVKVLALRCAGYNNVDFQSAFNKIHIVRVPDYSPYAIAEHTIALMMTLNRKIHKAYSRTKEANFSISGLLGFDLNGKTAGIVGTGKIAKIVIRILRGFGMNVLAFDLYPDNKFAEEMGITYTDLDSLYKNSDVISLHCPLTKDTEYLLREESFAKMKDGVMIINTGRGKLINTKDLIKSLKNGKVGYAGLDVYEEESSYFFEDKSDTVINDDTLARLLTFNNVIVTSHQAFFTKEALKNIADTTFKNIEAYLNGEELKNEICYRCEKYGGVCPKDTEKKCF